MEEDYLSYETRNHEKPRTLKSPEEMPGMPSREFLDTEIFGYGVAAGIFFCCVVIILVLVLGSRAKAQHPAAEVQSAVLDCEALPAEARPRMRYLSLYAIPPEHRDEAAAVIGFVANSTSRSSVIVQLHRVSNSLLRLDLAEIAPGPQGRQSWTEAWEAIAALDPYFRLKTTAIVPAVAAVPARRDNFGRTISPAIPAIEAVTKTVVTDGGWLDLEAAAKLRDLTGSPSALVRADWWLFVVTDTPAYYVLAAVSEKRADWEKQFGVVEAEIRGEDAALGGNLVKSGVTHKPRRVERWPTIHGAIWHSFDSARVSADKDPFRNPGFDLKYDAGEHIAARPNGLHEYALYNFAGARQDAVPAGIAIDDSVAPVTELRPFLSCVRCHNQNQNEAAPQHGLQGIVDQQSALLAGATLTSYDPKAIQSLAAFYSRQEKLQRLLARDREDYAAAVAKATGGLTPAKVAKLLSDLVDGYARGLVDPATAMRDLGIAGKPELLAALLDKTSDPALALLAQGHSIDRAQWEAAFSSAAILAANQIFDAKEPKE